MRIERMTTAVVGPGIGAELDLAVEESRSGGSNCCAG